MRPTLGPLPFTRDHPIDLGLSWLAANQNADGGWGDTTKSLSNISTTTLCWAAFGATNSDEKFSLVVRNAERWLAKAAGSIAPDQLAGAIIARYGKRPNVLRPDSHHVRLGGAIG